MKGSWLLWSAERTDKYDAEQKYIGSHLNLFGQLNDPELMLEYSEFSAKNRSILLIFLFNIYFTGAMISSIDSTLVLHRDHRHHNDNNIVILTHVQWILSVATALLGWVLFLRNLTYSWPNFQLGDATQWLRRFGQNCQYTMLMVLTLSYAVRLIIRVLSGKCEHGENPFHSYVWNCNPAAEMRALPFDTVAVLMFCPILYTCIMRETRFEYLVLSYTIVCFTLVFCACMIHSTNSITLIAPYMVFGILILYDSSNQNMLSFLNNRQLKQTLVENEKMAVNARSVEMRHLIANVAHDLKTPLTSFMAGVDFVSQIINECESCSFSDQKSSNGGYAEKCYQSIQSIKQVVHDIRNTNSFMLMTINRCVDYTKASVGLQLMPRKDRVDLVEGLKVPLCIVNNMQETRSVKLLPLPSGISRYVITDSQWLQENLLCLLSNAIKYSPTDSIVNLSISLIDQPYGSQVSTTQELASDKTFSKTVFSGKSDPVSDEFDDEFAPTVRYRSLSMKSPVAAVHPESQLGLVKGSNLKLLFRVEDEGIGIAPDLRDTLFSTVQQSSKRHSGGVGLGLYSLAKRIEALGGECGVENQPNGRSGSAFWFTIPYQPEEQSPHQLSTSKLQDKEELSITRIISTPEQERRRGMQERKGKSFADRKFVSSHKTENLNILVVEDSPVIAKMIRMTLMKDKHHVMLAENGQVGYDLVYKMVREHDDKIVFDVIITDLQMPIMNGMEFTQKVRSLEKSLTSGEVNPYCDLDLAEDQQIDERHVIIGTSANSDHESSTAALTSGADAFIPKPFSMNQFYSTLSSIHRDKTQQKLLTKTMKTMV